MVSSYIVDDDDELAVLVVLFQSLWMMHSNSGDWSSATAANQGKRRYTKQYLWISNHQLDGSL